MKLRRPTKEMMLAINAQLSGNTKEAEELVKTHRLNRKEMDFRIEKRAGEKYDLTKRRGRRTRGSVIVAASAPARDILTMIDGRTKTATLARLESRVAEILANRDKKEVAQVRQAVREVATLQRQIQAAENILGEV